MKRYQFKDFNKNDTCLVFRLDTQFKDKPVDIYILMELPTGIVLTQELVLTNLSKSQADELVQLGWKQKKGALRRILLTMGDPAEKYLQKSAKTLGVVYAIGDFENTKSSWEKALLYFPSDITAKRNLNEFIYHKNPIG